MVFIRILSPALLLFLSFPNLKIKCDLLRTWLGWHFPKTGNRRKTKSRRADKKKTTYKRRILISLAHEENLKGKLDDGVMWTVLNGDPDISVCPPNSFHLSTSCDLLCYDSVKYIGHRILIVKPFCIHYTKLMLIARKKKSFKREYLKFFFLCDVMGLFVVILFFLCRLPRHPIRLCRYQYYWFVCSFLSIYGTFVYRLTVVQRAHVDRLTRPLWFIWRPNRAQLE